MAVFAGGNPKLDFFEQNPTLINLTVFKDLVSKEGAAKASMILWAIYMVDDIESPMYRMPMEEKRKEVAKNYLNDPKFNWDSITHISDAYVTYAMPKTKAIYKRWMDKLDEMTAYMNKLNFDEHDDKLLKIFKESPKIWEAIDVIGRKMIEEETKSQVRGGGELSGRQKRN